MMKFLLIFIKFLFLITFFVVTSLLIGVLTGNKLGIIPYSIAYLLFGVVHYIDIVYLINNSVKEQVMNLLGEDDEKLEVNIVPKERFVILAIFSWPWYLIHPNSFFFHIFDNINKYLKVKNCTLK